MNQNSLCRAALALALAALSCKVDRHIVHEQIYGCDPKAVDPGCGTDEEQREMMCFAGRPLGGTDFCAERCEPGETMSAETVCSQSGARLQLCNPNVEGSCGDPSLGCYRNNVLNDSGVCVTITPCATDDQCRDPVRSVCAATFVKKIYQTPTSFKNDHLWCLQADCQANRTACSPGESCLRDLISPAAHPPDICVPNCDSNLRCPPASECYRKTAGPAAPAICIPGLLGFGCDATIDCMMGECVQIGEGRLKFCSTKCGNDADCAKYDGQQGQFLCNDAHQCVTPNALTGNICRTDSDCDPGLTCARLSAGSSSGTCLPPCGADGSCGPRGGVPHTCLPRADGLGAVCIPGFFGYPCGADANCLPGLSCRPLGPGQPNICSNLCADDGDCGKSRWTAGGYCQELKDMGVKICLSPLEAGKACERDTQCISGHCLSVSETAKACAPGDPS
jgi:hypothetical protein